MWGVCDGFFVSPCPAMSPDRPTATLAVCLTPVRPFSFRVLLVRLQMACATSASVLPLPSLEVLLGVHTPMPITGPSSS